jgi:hypothetical protein
VGRGVGTRTQARHRMIVAGHPCTIRRPCPVRNRGPGPSPMPVSDVSGGSTPARQVRDRCPSIGRGRRKGRRGARFKAATAHFVANRCHTPRAYFCSNLGGTLMMILSQGRESRSRITRQGAFPLEIPGRQPVKGSRKSREINGLEKREQNPHFGSHNGLSPREYFNQPSAPRRHPPGWFPSKKIRRIRPAGVRTFPHPRYTWGALFSE